MTHGSMPIYPYTPSLDESHSLEKATSQGHLSVRKGEGNLEGDADDVLVRFRGLNWRLHIKIPGYNVEMTSMIRLMYCVQIYIPEGGLKLVDLLRKLLLTISP